MDEDRKIIRCHFNKYFDFNHLCCVDTNPPAQGLFYCIEPNVAFVSYTYPFRHCGIRTQIWPEHKEANGHLNMDFLNGNIRNLSRIMVGIKYRGKGLAEYLIKHTIDTVGVRYVECVTFTPAIAHILEKCGFIYKGDIADGKIQYWLYEITNPVIPVGAMKEFGHPGQMNFIPE